MRIGNMHTIKYKINVNCRIVVSHVSEDVLLQCCCLYLTLPTSVTVCVKECALSKRRGVGEGYQICFLTYIYDTKY